MGSLFYWRSLKQYYPRIKMACQNTWGSPALAYKYIKKDD